MSTVFNLVVTVKFFGRVFSGVPPGVHGADEFLDINIIMFDSVQAHVHKHFKWGMMDEI